MAYSTIQQSFWTDPKIKSLSPNERFILLYLITNPHTHYSGIYYLPFMFIAEESGLILDTVKECLANLEATLLLRYDHSHSVVWVKNMCKHQMAQGGNPKALRRGIEKQLSQIHAIDLIISFNEHYQILNLTLPQGCLNVELTLPQRSVIDIDIDIDNKGPLINKKDSLVPHDNGSSKKKGSLQPSKEAVQLSQKLATLILKNDSSYFHLQGKKYQKHVNNSAVYIDRLIRIDKVKPEEVQKVIEWCQADSFWWDNILSGEKLREQYGQLKLKMKNPKTDTGKLPDVNPPYHQPFEEGDK